MKVLVGVAALAFLASTCWQRAVAPDPEPEPPLERIAVPADLGELAFGHVERLCSFGPRHTGSRGWQYAIDYIAVELQRLGLEPVRDRWTDEKEKVRFENISVTMPGRSDEKIVIGAHHDTKKMTGHPDREDIDFVGANDSASGVGLLLALASVLRERSNHATIELVFFDGEESIPYKWDMDRALFGSRRVVQTYTDARRRDPSRPAIRAFILLDMVGAKDLSIDDEGNSDRRLKDIFRRAAAACGYSDYFFKYTQTVSDDHLPFRDAGIPVIDLIDIASNPQWHTADDTIEHISARSLQIVGAVVLTALPEVERRFVEQPSNLQLPGQRR